MPAQRDPVSTWFDAAAVRLLRRAYERPGEWVGVYLAPPSQAQAGRLRALHPDYQPMARDRWGEYRWVRAYKRSVFWNLKKFGYHDELRPGDYRLSDWPAKSLEWETGKRVIKQGWPQRRWAIRIRLHPTGYAASKAAREKVPVRKRWIVNGVPTERQSTPADRG